MRPCYHYAPTANWLSDPNGLVWLDGEWHMFYQYNPFGEEWGHMSWGHAVSPDLAHWQELPVALAEADQTMIFSGSAVIDHNGTAGFGVNAMVAVYTGARTDRLHQFQCLASSTDRGRNFVKFAGNPVLDRQMADFRDPSVFWHEPSGQWIMVVVLSDENRALLYGSPDLTHWTELSEISRDGAPGHLWECPFLVELSIDGTRDTRWLFKVDVLSGAPGSGALYRIGQFDGMGFKPESGWLVADHGDEFYAAIGWPEPRDAKGRPTWIGWMGNHAVQKHLPLQGWRGAMSLPRRLSLRKEAGELRLVQEIEPSCAIRFTPPESPITMGEGCRPLPAGSLLELSGAERWQFTLTDDFGRNLAGTLENGRLTVTRTDPVTPQLNRTSAMRVAIDAPVRIWLDTGSIEVIASNGADSLTLQHRLAGEAWALRGEGVLSVRYFDANA
ncbi:glycoside hydrolase family 32 protein [Novosphingobium taihuense]|uniref:Sucrose-6-phosphate hydrolase SacC (GH32 family) n=1 Tax=Novosphingobium taihuense TaxID=260085 RepID=A0A7W7ACT0_9SPHN|nr:glycoside hydrolase family 32 protein [Novosphingobium taihuense]MBB4613782.1 sucrose-6-phosphate hydrolase SacC (GH32 family) [Novosphingobium taihuense]TWH83291.1 levanase/fructan beta-fructosidase [Novosphingobium taihuense]